MNEQSAGSDPKLKRNSGLFSFFRWFKSASRESVNSDSTAPTSGSSDSLNSTGTAASFSFVQPTAYGKTKECIKCVINPGPETDTYKARLRQRDKVRERDKNLTLRKKYNLFFNRDSLLVKEKPILHEDSSKSLPLMTRKMDEDPKGHRRSNSDSSKSKKAGAYLHVKGKRKAPQPPRSQDGTISLRRKKRLAPQPPAVSADKVISTLNTDTEDATIIFNDSLKLDHGILKPAKETEIENSPAKSAAVEAPVSPRPWYKRNTNQTKVTQKEEKRKSTMMFLTNISELDREASEIIKKGNQKNVLNEMPEFMRPKENNQQNNDTLLPKRKSTKDLIAKFNAITNVTKVTVNSAIFAARESSVFQKNKENAFVPLAKSGTSACIIKSTKPTTPKVERKRWTCPKCHLENDYWRIICHVCSNIKPYFDDLTASPTPTKNTAKNATENAETKPTTGASTKNIPERNLERSKTQISIPLNKTKDEREKLKKMLIEMKNSLPKRKSNIVLKQNQIRKSTIEENPEVENLQAKLPINETFQLMRPKDFEDIYSEKSGGANHLYANLAQSGNLFLNVPKRISEIKNNLNANADTLEINRLLRRLESAIAKGDLSDAAVFAQELAQLKVNCSVTRQKSASLVDNAESKQGFMVEMFVEDRLSHRGPFPLEVIETQTVMELKKQVEEKFEIPVAVQRWILGKALASNDNATLKDHNVSTNGCPIFLYLVACSSNNNNDNVTVHYEEKKTEVKILNTEPSTSSSALKPEKEELKKVSNFKAPRIVEEKFKPIEKISDSKSQEILKIIDSVSNCSSPKIKPNVVRNESEASSSGLVKVKEKTPPKAVEEDFSDYDKTIVKPKKSAWDCNICTLLNPNTTNICLVCSSIRSNETKDNDTTEDTKKHYLELMNLDQADLVLSIEPFECIVCMTDIAEGEGVTLRECLHQFCKNCLANIIEFCEEAEVKCPYRDKEYFCDITLQDREVKALVNKTVYDQFLARSIAQAENKMDKSFHCKTPDCKGWCIFEDNVNEFQCPVCRKTNCLTCQAIHTGMNCKQYQERMNIKSETDEDAKRTRLMLEEMVNKGEALTCPACQVILMKKWGCDWVRCSMCKTEICWVTRGLRWGPGGKGDTSGGCKCGVNGVKCHPKCSYCH